MNNEGKIATMLEGTFKSTAPQHQITEAFNQVEYQNDKIIFGNDGESSSKHSSAVTPHAFFYSNIEYDEFKVAGQKDSNISIIFKNDTEDSELKVVAKNVVFIPGRNFRINNSDISNEEITVQVTNQGNYLLTGKEFDKVTIYPITA